jgi:hypothetical protein
LWGDDIPWNVKRTLAIVVFVLLAFNALDFWSGFMNIRPAGLFLVKTWLAFAGVWFAVLVYRNSLG